MSYKDHVCWLERQRYSRDCGVAALASLYYLTYEDAEERVKSALPGRRFPICGMRVIELVRSSSYMGRELQRVVRFDPQVDCGILCVSHLRWFIVHFVVLVHGVVLDPGSGEITTFEYFCRYWKVRSLLRMPPRSD